MFFGLVFRICPIVSNITWMEKVNNFQIAKDHPQRVTYLLLYFFKTFSWPDLDDELPFVCVCVCVVWLTDEGRVALFPNIFTAKIFSFILNDKTLLYSGLSWIFSCRSNRLKIASKILSRTFQSITLTTFSRQKEEEKKTNQSINQSKQIYFTAE